MHVPWSRFGFVAALSFITLSFNAYSQDTQEIKKLLLDMGSPKPAVARPEAEVVVPRPPPKAVFESPTLPTIITVPTPGLIFKTTDGKTIAQLYVDDTGTHFELSDGRDNTVASISGNPDTGGAIQFLAPAGDLQVALTRDRLGFYVPEVPGSFSKGPITSVGIARDSSNGVFGRLYLSQRFPNTKSYGGALLPIHAANVVAGITCTKTAGVNSAQCWEYRWGVDFEELARSLQ